ncbi:Aste57867_20133 [Aphanomyces stellatus]|uniref:Aste57867_20133 protein n=1 Tax=Aphanomyces stellatus TaxID=120398 RepID=A0A485LG80_9STRA|nr:hypothetical protein As57867_020067 [Aphanomyces stellatus]VFT96828.1 Aste57867_20133 [Aphanomyces stellatus]
MRCRAFVSLLLAMVISASMAEPIPPPQRNDGVDVTNHPNARGVSASVSPASSSPDTQVALTQEPVGGDDTETDLWCTDVGLNFELDYKTANSDFAGFAHYFNARMQKKLQGMYMVAMKDLSPSQTALYKPFVVFTICSRSANLDGRTWLGALQAALPPALLRGKAIPVLPGQESAVADLVVYPAPPHAAHAELIATPMSTSIAAVAADSNGEPLLRLSLRVKNTGGLPLRIFQVVAHGMVGFRDTVLQLPSPIVLRPDDDFLVELKGSLVQEKMPTVEVSIPMRLHVVQSSGEKIDLGVAALVVPPPGSPVLDGSIGSKESDAPDDAQDAHEDTLDNNAELDGNAIDLMDDSVPATTAIHALVDPFKVEKPTGRHYPARPQRTDAANNNLRLHPEDLRVDTPRQQRVGGGVMSGGATDVLPMESFPSSAWKAVSVLLMAAVVIYSSYFVYSKLRNKSIAWGELKKGKKSRKTPYRAATTVDDGMDGDDDDDAKECEMMLRKPREDDVPVLVVAPARTEPIEPIQLNHAWGRASPSSSSAARLQPQPMRPIGRGKTSPTSVPETPPPTAPYELELDPTSRLHPKRFESLWEEYVELYVELKTWTRSVDTTWPAASAIVIALFESQGLLCMASGSVQKMDKYLFYGHEVTLDQFVFVEVVVNTVVMDVSLSVRGHRDLPRPALDAFATLTDLLFSRLTHV